MVGTFLLRVLTHGGILHSYKRDSTCKLEKSNLSDLFNVVLVKGLGVKKKLKRAKSKTTKTRLI